MASPMQQTPPTTTAATLTDRPRVHNASPSADRKRAAGPHCDGPRAAAPRSPRRSRPVRRLNPNLGQLDPNGPNQGVVIGLDEDAPFRAALGQIKALLDTLGVEGTVAKIRPAEPDGPIIPRDYEVGLPAGGRIDCGLVLPMPSVYQERGERKTPPFCVLRPEGRRRGQPARIALFRGGRHGINLLTAKGQLLQRHRRSIDGVAMWADDL